MTTPSYREIAEHWFEVLKSSPFTGSRDIEDDFIGKLAATWPWIQAYFEMLDIFVPSTSAEQPKEFPWVATMGVYALQETLGLRYDCAAAFFMLLLISRVRARLQEPLPPKVLNKCPEAIDQLVKAEDKKDWLKWIEELWRR